LAEDTASPELTEDIWSNLPARQESGRHSRGASPHPPKNDKTPKPLASRTGDATKPPGASLVPGLGSEQTRFALTSPSGSCSVELELSRDRSDTAREPPAPSAGRGRAVPPALRHRAEEAPLLSAWGAEWGARTRSPAPALLPQHSALPPSPAVLAPDQRRDGDVPALPPSSTAPAGSADGLPQVIAPGSAETRVKLVGTLQPLAKSVPTIPPCPTRPPAPGSSSPLPRRPAPGSLGSSTWTCRLWPRREEEHGEAAGGRFVPGAEGQAARLCGDQEPAGPWLQQSRGRRSCLGQDQPGAGKPPGLPQCWFPELCPRCWSSHGAGDTGSRDPELGGGLLSTPQPRTPQSTHHNNRVGREVSTAHGAAWGGGTMGQGGLGPGSATANCDKKCPPPCPGPRALQRRGRDFPGFPRTSGSAPNLHLEVGTVTTLRPHGAGPRARCRAGRGHRPPAVPSQQGHGDTPGSTGPAPMDTAGRGSGGRRLVAFTPTKPEQKSPSTRPGRGVTPPRADLLRQSPAAAALRTHHVPEPAAV